MQITGKYGFVTVNGRTLRFLNQRSREWTHPYEYPPHPGGTLTSSGCGIFSACHAAEVMSGKRVSPELLADFSCREGGRGDDGTNRPKLLAAMQEKSLAASYGFRYDGDGLLNDHEALWKTMQEGGCALCNLRVGHIVTLIAAREQNGERQLLAMDCHSESGDERVRDHVIEVVETSAVVSPITNQRGFVTGYQVNYGLFWVPLSLPRDFNLLHPLNKETEEATC